MTTGKPTVIRGALLATLLSPAWAGAQHFEIGLGVLDEIDDHGAETATLGWYPRDGEWPLEIMVGHMTSRSPTPTTLGSPSVNFVSFSLQRQFTPGWFLGFGVAAIDDQSEVLSSTHQFLSSAGYRFGKFSLVLRHMSNGNTGGRNRGENLLTLNYSF